MMNVLNLADYVINLCNHKYHCGTSNSNYKQPITHLYLNKLLYFLNIECALKFHGSKVLVPKNTFNIWAYGPVNSSVFSDYQRFGDSHITHTCKHIMSMSFDKNGNVNARIGRYSAKDVPVNVQKFVQAHLPRLLIYSQFDLVNFAKLNPQWQDMWEHGGCYKYPEPAVDTPYNFYKDYTFYKNPNHQFWNDYTSKN